jgi:tRNA pseudouridine38-40 synthase
VLRVEEADPEFHARFDAVRRVYLYSILNRRAPTALARGLVWRVSRTLDAEAMHDAAQRLIGHHDFTTFRDSHCQAKSPVKTLDRFDVSRDGETIQVWCEARSFLHRQVRSMVGTMVEVGLGKMSAQEVADALAAADRTRCGPVAPADGLYLARVDYAK